MAASTENRVAAAAVAVATRDSLLYALNITLIVFSHYTV